MKLKAEKVEKYSLSIVFFQAALVLIHFIIRDYFVLYRELLSLLILFCVFLMMFTNRGRLLISHETILILFGVFFLIIAVIADPGDRTLYTTGFDKISEHVDQSNAKFYILRTYLLYIPSALLLMIICRPQKTLHAFFWFIVVLSPLAIYLFIISHELLDVLSFYAYMGLQGRGLAYNTYVPALTFPFILSLYLSLYNRHSSVRYIAYTCSVILFLYIAFSGSRQSLLFCFLAILIMVFYISQYKLTFKFLCILGIVILVVFLGVTGLEYYQILSVITRERGMFETTRTEIITRGFKLLSPIEFFTGAGATSVMYSGPHNDYVRWIQRIGLFGAVLLFIPFIFAMLRVIKTSIYIRRFGGWRSRLNMSLAFLSVFYGLYHSLFGYPREDAFQAVFLWIGFGLSLAICRIEEKNTHKGYNI